jgi:uncharacterized protein YbjT (DUF2867 family)
MADRILVIGATGLLGEPVAQGLREAGYSVRVMSRDVSRARARFPEPFEVVPGDALKVADVEKALVACDAVHVSIDHDQEAECVDQVLEAARGQMLQRITYISGTTVCEENRWFPLVDRKLRSEEAIRTSGIDYTIFCPGWFMEMVARFVHGDRVYVFGRPRRRWHFVALQDFARMVVEGYRRPEAVNKRFYVHGPQALTVLEALQSYCRVLHPEIKKLRGTPYWLLRLIARFSGNARMRKGIDMVSYLERVGERGNAAEANAILGAPQMTLDQWLQLQSGEDVSSGSRGQRVPTASGQ